MSNFLESLRYFRFANSLTKFWLFLSDKLPSSGVSRPGSLDESLNLNNLMEATGQQSKSGGTIDDLFIALGFFTVTVYLCNLLREVVLFSRLLDGLRDGHKYKLLVAEMIGMLEAAVACYEINFIVYDVFGVELYVASLLAFGLWQMKRAPIYEYDGNPLTVMEKYIEAVHPMRRHHFRDVDPFYQKHEFVALMIGAQIVAALLAFHGLVQLGWKNAMFWPFVKDNYHTERYNTRDGWQSSISKSIMFAALIEGFYSMLNYLLPFYIKFRGFRGQAAAVLVEIGKAIFSGFGAPYTGGYFNPVLGFILESQTGTHSNLAKFFVYCIAPVIGTLLGMVIGSVRVR